MKALHYILGLAAAAGVVAVWLLCSIATGREAKKNGDTYGGGGHL